MTKDDIPDVEIDIVLPPRSLIVASGAARYDWKHGIKRSNIHSRRVAMTFRELTPEFYEGGDNQCLGKELRDIAMAFKGVAVGAQSHTTSSG